MGLKDPTMYCRCGRTAEWIGDRSNLPECFEAIYHDDPALWKMKLPRDQKPRHLIKEIEE